MKAPYNPHRTIRVDYSGTFAKCETCGKPTLYACTICGQCCEEANRR